jgi:phosphinothricin acetyltransferase
MFDNRINIRPLAASDWKLAAEIYQEGLDTGNSSFTQFAPASWEEWTEHKLADCRLAATLDGQLAGWAMLSPVFSRAYYRGVTELSIYVGASAHGHGIGSALMDAMIKESEAKGIWMLQSLVFPENAASMHLHLKHGFKLMCVHERMGFMTFGPYAGLWRDVALLERRSKIAGVGKDE